MKRTILAFFPLSLWAAAVLVVGGMESVPVPSLPAHADKLGHFIMYGVGGMLAAWAGRFRGRWAGMAGLLLVMLTGALDELHQTTIAARHGSVGDWVADAVGAIFFYLVATRFLRKE